MKTFILTTVLAMAAATLHANAEGYRSMQIITNESSPMLVNMESDMKVSFITDSLQIAIPGIRISFPLEEISGWEFCSEASDLGLGALPNTNPAFEPAGDGTALKPYNSLALLQKTDEEDVWVTGYIIGSFSSDNIASGAIFADGPHLSGNLLLAPAPGSNNTKHCIGVRLDPDSDIHSKLNLADNPDNLGKEISIKGSAASYGGSTGLINPKAYVWGNRGNDNNSVGSISGDPNLFSFSDNCITLNNLPAATPVQIFSIDGTTVVSRICQGSLSISLDGLNNGIYILNINGKSAKISVNR